MYFVDGNNIMANRLEIDLGTRLAEEYLIHAIARWAAHTGTRVVLAFDGHPKNPPNSTSDLVKIVRPADVAGARTADDVLLHCIKEFHAGQTATLVTNDGQLQRAAHGLGVRHVIDSQTFLEAVKSVDPEIYEATVRNNDLTQADVAAWEAEFTGGRNPDIHRTNTRSPAKPSGNDEWANYLANQNIKPLGKKK